MILSMPVLLLHAGKLLSLSKGDPMDGEVLQSLSPETWGYCPMCSHEVGDNWKCTVCGYNPKTGEPQTLSTSEAWTFLAVVFEKAHHCENKNRFYVNIADIYCYGICESIRTMYSVQWIPRRVKCEMLASLPGDSVRAYSWSIFTEEGKSQRVAFCKERAIATKGSV